MKNEKISFSPFINESFSLGLKSMKGITITTFIYILPILICATLFFALLGTEIIPMIFELAQTNNISDGDIYSWMASIVLIAGLIFLIVILYFFINPLYTGTILTFVKAKDENTDNPMKFAWTYAKDRYGKLLVYSLLMNALIFAVGMALLIPIMIIAVIISLTIGPEFTEIINIITYPIQIYFTIIFSFGMLCALFQDREVFESLKHGWKLAKGRVLKYISGLIVIYLPLAIIFIIYFVVLMIFISPYIESETLPSTTTSIFIGISTLVMVAIATLYASFGTAAQYVYYKKLLEVNGEFSDNEIEKNIIDDSYESEMSDINRFDE
ncbi:MAG: hypothetical protein JXR63_12515 [Spirochaetales bacterium]|nr:hypothetical protein [Spirochaetales bacterium]